MLHSNSTSGNHIISKINYADYVDYKVTFRCVPHNFIGSGPSKDINLEVQGMSMSFPKRNYALLNIPEPVTSMHLIARISHMQLRTDCHLT